MTCPRMVQLTIDGRPVAAEEGSPLIEAVKAAGIEITHYCYHPGLPPDPALGQPGACRMCLVEVEGARKPQVSCRVPVKEGMVVRVASPAAARARRASLEFHLVNHPLDCPVCDQSGECYLQDYYQRHGPYRSSVRKDKRHKAKRADIGRHVVLDAERCVLCQRCVRFLDAVTGTGELGIFNMRDEAELMLAPGKRLDNPYSGNVVDICPVGALTDKDFRFKCRVWYLESTPSLCAACARCCSIDIHTVCERRRWQNEGRRVARLKPRFNPAVNGYWMCDEGRYGFGRVDAASRLRLPSAAEGTRNRELSWEEAFRLIAAQLKELSAQRGPDGLAVALSGALSDEDLYGARALFAGPLRTRRLLIRPEPEQLGEEDAILRRRERVPNLRGALELGFGRDIEETTWDRLRDALRARELWGLYVVGRDPLAVWKDPDIEGLLAGLPFTLQQDQNVNGFTRLARWVLPCCSYMETDATFVNFEGTVQRARKALEPLGSSRPGWRIFAGLLRALGGAFPHEGPRSIFEALSKESPLFAGLDFDRPGPEGRAWESTPS